MICPSQVMWCPCCGMGSVAVADDDTTFLLAAPKCIFGAAIFIGPCGACGAIYRCGAPVSTIPVYTSGSEVPTRFTRWILLVWVGLKRLILIKHFLFIFIIFSAAPPPIIPPLQPPLSSLSYSPWPMWVCSW